MPTYFDHPNLTETFDNKKQTQPSSTTASSASTTTTSFKNNENISAKLINSKPTSGTPKRRISYQNMNSPPPGKLPTPGILPNKSNDDLSPFIKRKCLARELKSIKFSALTTSNLINQTDSPYMLASSNLNTESAHDSSPKHLNDSFETNGSIKITSRYLSRRRFSKHKSAPLTNLTQQFTNAQYISSPISMGIHQPLNDISNQINRKLTNSIQNGFKLSEEGVAGSEENLDDVTELENLIFGNGNGNQIQSSIPLVRQTTNPNFIKQSLEKDSIQGKSLIGDRSRTHVLPPICSNKHPDLNCISPETLVDVLNGVYESRIKEVVIIDSRYPYEYEGGHIAHALNIYTKERLYDEMFIKRSQKHSTLLNNSTMDMDSSSESLASPETKRSIIIFHCEFSSERAPGLLKFLRNSDRTLNESCYPNLFYPELYLLEGGYKSFYEKFTNYCEPQTYKPMLHEAHQYDYKHFRAKAKSWEVSRQHIVYKYNEHLQRQQSLHTQKEQENEHDGMSSSGSTEMVHVSSTSTTSSTTTVTHRKIKMKF